MKYLFITNNDDAYEYLKGLYHNSEVIFINGNIKEVAFVARDNIMLEYTLAADPLAGRRERPTPYLTIILRENKEKKDIGYDILRVEKFSESYDKHGEFLDKVESHKLKDYKAIDTSLTKSACIYIRNN